MRILVVSNLYPPYYIGGYELGCKDVVEGLKARGHDVRVLTSTYKIDGAQIEGEVYRWLRICLERRPDWLAILNKEMVNQIAFKYLCAHFQPDIVFFWNMTHISISLAFLAQKLGIPTFYYVFDNWISTWEMDHWRQLWFKKPIVRKLKRFFGLIEPEGPLDLKGSMFASRYLKNVALQVGKDVTQAPVIPWGVNIHRFTYKKESRKTRNRLLYVGQVLPHKGVHNSIKALGFLKGEHGCDSVTLTIAGDIKSSPEYTLYLKEIAQTYGVKERINFIGHIPHEDLPDLYHNHDILIFPSVWDEPFGIVLLEAMSCGLAVVATETGGSSEILEDGFNALIFHKDDPESCARQILRLIKNSKIFDSIRENGRRMIELKFQISKMVDSIEKVLMGDASRLKADQQCSHLNKKTFIVENSEEKAIPDPIKQCERGLWLLRPLRFIRNLSIKKLKAAPYLLALQAFPILFKPIFLFVGIRNKSLQINLEQVKSVLFLQLANVGDVVLSIPFLRELRCLMPHAWIGIVVQPHTYGLVEKCPYVDKVFTFNWKNIRNWRTAIRGHILWWLQATWLAARKLWQYKIDMAISPRWNSDSCQAASLILMFTSGACWRIGYMDPSYNSKNFTRKTALDQLLSHGPIRGFQKHEVERQLDVLRFLGAKVVNTDLEVWITSDDERFAQEVMRKHGIGDNDLIIGLAPGAGWPGRRWPLERFIELAKWLRECYHAYILITGSEHERDLGSRIECELQKERIVNLTGKTTLRQMVAVVRHCRLFVGNDSGSIHVAAAAGVPVVGLFGPGEYERFKPWGVKHEVVRLNLLCSPCSENCIVDYSYCMEGITVSQVKRIISAKLEIILRDTKKM